MTPFLSIPLFGCRFLLCSDEVVFQGRGPKGPMLVEYPKDGVADRSEWTFFRSLGPGLGDPGGIDSFMKYDVGESTFSHRIAFLFEVVLPEGYTVSKVSSRLTDLFPAGTIFYGYRGSAKSVEELLLGEKGSRFAGIVLLPGRTRSRDGHFECISVVFAALEACRVKLWPILRPSPCRMEHTGLSMECVHGLVDQKHPLLRFGRPLFYNGRNEIEPPLGRRLFSDGFDMFRTMSPAVFKRLHSSIKRKFEDDSYDECKALYK